MKNVGLKNKSVEGLMTKNVLFILTLLIFSIFPPVLNAVIRVETFQGHQITPYIHKIVQLCDKMYREYPYFYNGDNEGYQSYLESYAQSKDAIISLAFEGEKAVGIAAGIPMSKTRNLYQQTLLEHGYNLHTLFYLGEFGLKAEYQGQGIEETLYRNIENYVNKDGHFSAICFWEIDDSLNSRQKQLGYLLKDDFWKRLGFVRRPELNFLIFWTNINETQESAHSAVYWMKNMR